MNWINPKLKLPVHGQLVWVMLEPHKIRGSLLQSAPSIQVVCGWVQTCNDGEVIVSNYDELGSGGISWVLVQHPEDPDYYSQEAIAWMPVEDMPLPDFWVET